MAETYAERAPEQTRETKSLEYFEPITRQEIERLREDLSESMGMDLSGLPVEITKPGEFLFDLYEAQTKLYNKLGDWETFVTTLRKAGYDFHAATNGELPNADKLMRKAALEHGVVLDGRMPGFLYNIGGNRIIYFAIAEDRVMDMAESYAKKEQRPGKFGSLKEAEEFLRELSEKYFYHEVGHTVFLHLLPEEIQELWDTYIRENKGLTKRVIEVQRDKHPTAESIPVGNEAFADIFTEIATAGRITNRLGKHREESETAKEILKRLGFRIPE